ncbi:hypothetical protein QPJ43_03840, partial [Clostridioides difficile]|nr:hypothetical protein [Clostridioides difficile]
DANAGNAGGDANAGNAGGDANAGNAGGDANAGNAGGDANAGNAEEDANAGNAEEDSNAGNAEEDMNALVVEEATAEDPTSVGDFKISGGEINVDFKFASGVLTILSGKQMTIQNNNPNTPTTHRIVIPKDVKAELIFDGVNIKTASNSPFTLTPDKDGGAYAHVILQDGSENKLESGDVYYPGMRAGKGTTLTIDDSVVNRDIEGEFIVPEGGKIPRDVTLENGDKLKKGDRLTLLDSNNRGSLKVVGNYYSAGIGGGNTESGGNIKPDDFYVKDIGSGSQFLKQYEEFTIDDTPPYLIIKRYDGLPFEEDVEKLFLDWILKDGGIPIITPKGEKLTDKKFMTISSQRLNEETMEPDTNLGSDDLTKQVDAGKYQLSITSTQFSNVYPFNEAYWGHRAYYKAEIIPADTETSLVVEESKAKTDVFKPTDTFTLNVTISPDKKEGPDCASPRGYVQFYINGKEYKDPVELKTHNKGSESHNYSTASIEWRPLDSNHHIFTTEQTITVKYIGDDINYIEGSEDEKKLKLDMTNVDVDGDGIPDINIDTDGDGRPDINIDTSGDWKPDINIDTDNTGEWKPSTEGGNGDGIWKPDKNIDTNGDGNPDTDYNRPAIDTDNDGVDDYWKPDKNVDTGSGGYDTGNPNLNKPDPDNGGNSKPDPDNGGNSKPDSGNGGNSKPDSGNGGNSKPDSGNGGNSKPDSGNGGNSKPDPDNGGNSKPDPDNGGNGKPDPDNGGNSKPDPDNGGNSKPDPDNGGNSKPDIDTDGDGKPNINIDTDGDGKPDINIDTDGDGKPDINIDIDGDGKPDINIDIDGDGKPDINIDTDGDGKPDINIDTDGNGKPDINIDTDESLDSNVGQNVQTGDQSNIMLDLALMFISLFFLIKNLTNKYLRRK